MMRDIVFNVHIGGNCDVYIKVASFTSAFQDFFGLEVDVSRQSPGRGTVALLIDSVGFFLGHSSIDRTNVVPFVRAIDGLVSYFEGTDYAIDDLSGSIFRLPAGNIFHEVGSIGVVTDTKTLTEALAFVGVRRGMILTIDTPGTVAGSYVIKDSPDPGTVIIYGEFPVGAETGVNWQIDDNLTVDYEYNPVAIDVIQTARAVDREIFTITDVPFMFIASIQVLDPLSGEPTGELLNSLGGFGAGGFGVGGFGVGSGADFRLIVSESTLRHSTLEDNYIEFDAAFAGFALRVNYFHAPGIPPIQAFMDDRNNQSETASLLARHHIPIFVDSQEAIIYDIPVADEATAISTDEMKSFIDQHVDDIDEGTDLETSDIIDVMYDNGASRVDVGTVQSLRGEIHNHDGSIEFTLPDDAGSVVVPEPEIADPSDKPLSPRIARFRSRSISVERNVV
jgi:hypothetical protein